MHSLLLVKCEVLETLRYVKHILNEDECRSIWSNPCWEDELAVVIAVKPRSAVQKTLGVLEDYREYSLDLRIKHKLCSMLLVN